VDATMTEADGSYLIRVPPGEHYLYLMLSLAPDGFSMPAQKDCILSVADRQTVEFDFKLPRGPKMPLISGRVVDEDGKPVGEATISIQPSGRVRPPFAFTDEKTSAADGSFQFKMTFPEAKVRARKDQMATLAPVEVKGQENQQIDLKVESNALAGISGTVVDAHGDLLVGATIQLSDPSISFQTAATGKEGTFRIDGLWPDGSYGVEVSTSGKSVFKKYGLQMKPGEILDLGRLELKDIDSFVSGTAFDINGNPAAGIRVSINGTKMSPRVVTQTDKDGKFRIPAVSGDTFDLYANYGETSIASRKVSAGEENIQMFPPVRRR
jgi:hypothetical protein